MKEIHTTYTVKGRNFPSVWIFKYDLDGYLKQWTIEEGELSTKQIDWLFHPKRFPYLERDMQTHLMSIKNLEIEKGEPDISFDAFYSLYNKKVSKHTAKKAWSRLSKADKLTALKKIKEYDGYLNRKRTIDKAYPATFLNKRMFEDDFNTLG